MKIRKEYFGILAILGAMVALGLACKPQSIPTAPAPTNTPTFTSTFTKTPVASSTPTNTPTNSPTGTVTGTATPTATTTPTSTPTSTCAGICNTGTPTNTATNSPTSTITNTPTSTPSGTPTLTPTSTTVPLAAGYNSGDIAFTALVQNGGSEFAFVNTNSSNISSGVTIYFTNESYDTTLNGGTGGLANESITYGSAQAPFTSAQGNEVVIAAATTVTEGIVAYEVTAAGGLPPYTEEVISSTGDDPALLTYGTTVVGKDLTFNHNGTGHKILAFSIPSAGTTVWLGAVIFGPDSWQSAGPIGSGDFWDTCLPSGLASGTNATDLSTYWNSLSMNSFPESGEQNENTILNCQTTESLADIVSPANWAMDGNVSKNASSSSGFGLELDGTASGSVDAPSPDDICTSGVGWVTVGPFDAVTSQVPTPTATP